MEEKPLIDDRRTEDVVAFSILPIVRAQLWGFAVSDILLAAGLALLHPSARLIVSSTSYALKIWAVIFFLLGSLTIYGIISRKTKLLRWVILCLLFVKLTWLIALFIGIKNGGTLFFAVIWSLAAYLLLLQYIYYFSENKNKL